MVTTLDAFPITTYADFASMKSLEFVMLGTSILLSRIKFVFSDLYDTIRGLYPRGLLSTSKPLTKGTRPGHFHSRGPCRAADEVGLSF